MAESSEISSPMKRREHICVACKKKLPRKKVKYVNWGTYSKDSRDVVALKTQAESILGTCVMICHPCDKNLLETLTCGSCKYRVHKRPVKVLQWKEKMPKYWCSVCDPTGRGTRFCSVCMGSFNGTHLRKVCSGLHEGNTPCGTGCGDVKVYVCRSCYRALNAIYNCTCCHRLCGYDNVLPYREERYDMGEYNVAAALHERVRLKVNGTEYICKTCDKSLVGSDKVGPMMPRHAFARKCDGAGEAFLRAIREKPEFVCTCCHRWRFHRTVMEFDSRRYNYEDSVIKRTLAKEMRRKMKVDVYKGERCPHIHAIPYDIYDSIEDEVGDGDTGVPDERKDEDSIYSHTISREYICVTCDRYLSRRKPVMPPMACANGLKLDPIPAELDGLTELERRIIAKRIPFMSIFCMKRYGSHLKIRGGCTNVPTVLEPVARILPRLSSEVQYHPMKLKRKLSFRSNYMYNWIRKDKVMNAIRWLMTNNTLYKDVEENAEWWREWNESDFRDLLVGADSNCGWADEGDLSDEVGGSDNEECGGYDERTVEEIVEDKHASDHSLLISGKPAGNMLQAQYLENEVVCCAPGENMEPRYMLMDEQFEEHAFPDLFPYGHGGYNSSEKRSTKLNMRQYFQQRVLNVDGRFGKGVEYLFCAQYVSDIKQLQGNTYVALRLKQGKTLDGRNVTAGMMRNVKELQQLARNEQAWKVLKTVRGSPPYWQHELYELLAMLRALGKPTFFITLSAADLHWREMLEATAVHKGQRLSLQEIRRMPIKERSERLQSNAALAAWMFQYRVECFETRYLKHSSNPIGKVSDTVFKIEFQERGSPHVHGLLWIEGAPRIDIDDDEVVAAFIDAHISGNVPSVGKDCEFLRRQVERYQMHSHSKYCRRSHVCRFGFPKPVCRSTLIARECTDNEQQKELVKSAEKVLLGVYKATEEATIGETIDDILARSGISEDAYKLALRCSHRGSNVIITRGAADICVNNYNPGILRYWGANMDLQYVIDEFSTVMYVCSYMMKSEKEMGEVLKCVSRECVSEPVKQQLRKIGKAFLGTRVVSAPEAAMRLMSLWYIKKSREVRYVDANMKCNRVTLPKPMYQLEQMDESDEDIYMTTLHDRYRNRPDELENMCLLEFASSYDPVYGKRDMSLEASNGERNDSDGNSEHSVEIGEEFAVICLKGNLGRMRKRKKKTVPQVKMYKVGVDAESYYHARLMLYKPWRVEEELLGDHGTYEASYMCHGEDVEEKAKLYNLHAKEIDSAIDRLASDGAPESVWDKMAPNTEQENANAMEEEKEHVTNTDGMEEEQVGFCGFVGDGRKIDERHGQHKLSQLYERIARKDVMEYKQYRRLMRSLNVKQKQIVVFNRMWCKKFIRCWHKKELLDGYKVFLSGAGGTGKSYVIQLIQRDIVHFLTPMLRPDPAQPLVMLTAPTGTAAFNIDGTTIHSAFSMQTRYGNKEDGGGTTSERRWIAENKLQWLMLLVIDEISMVGRETFQRISSTLSSLKHKIDKDWGGCSILAVGDLMQLDPIGQLAAYRDPKVWSPGDMAPLLWDDLMFHELDETMRQKDAGFSKMLATIRMLCPEEGSPEDKILQSREITCSVDDVLYPRSALHVYARNIHCDTWNQRQLELLPGDIKTYRARDRTKDNKTMLVSVELPANASKTGNLRQCLLLKVGAKVMLTANIDVSDGLTNGAMGIVEHLPVSGMEVLVRFENGKVGVAAKTRNQYKAFPDAVVIRRIEVSFGWKGRKTINISRTQFPLMLAWGVTIHKVQGATLDEIVVDMDPKKGKFQPGQAYVALSRVKCLDKLHILNYDRRQITVNQKALREMDRSGKNTIPEMVPTYMCMAGMEEHMLLVHLNIQGLVSKLADICCCEELLKAHVVCYTETHLCNDDSISTDAFGDNSNKYQIFRCDRDRYGGGLMVVVRRDYCARRIEIGECGTCEILVVEVCLSNHRLYIVCVYRPPKEKINEWLTVIHGILGILSDGLVCIVGDMNENLLDVSASPNIMKWLVDNGFEQHVKSATTDYGSLLDHVYSRNIPMNAIFVQVTDCYFSDHDIVTCVLSKSLGALCVDNVSGEEKGYGKEVDEGIGNMDSGRKGDDVCDALHTEYRGVCSNIEGSVAGGMLQMGHDRVVADDKTDSMPVDGDVEEPENMDVDIVLMDEERATDIRFVPLTVEQRLAICKRLGMLGECQGGIHCIPYTGEGNYCEGSPSKCNWAKAIGDGNCLFRAYSFLLCGNQDLHDMVRMKVCDYIANPINWRRMETYISGFSDGEEYVVGSCMNMSGTWATEVELFAFALLTGKDVIVFTRDRWLVHSAGGCASERSDGAFYLDNVSGCHFDPVVGVAE